ncbi:MAG: monovalent cation/H(+) antiporter subunit G [Planctomycetota bacterium]
MEMVWLISALALAGLGTLLILLAAVGVLRMPDVYMRMQVASKASTLGAALVLVGAAVGLGDSPAAVRAAVAIVFLCITTPVGAHLLGRSAARKGVPFSEETRRDPAEFDQPAEAE